MARGRKNEKNAEQGSNIITLNVPAGNDLPLRLKKISKQTGLSSLDLFQKWVLQEESMIGMMGLMSNRSKRTKLQAEEKEEKTVSPRRASRKAAPVEVEAHGEMEALAPKSSDYRQELVDRVKQLKKEGLTLKKIADIFNGEQVATVSGTGKWYTSSVSWLMNSSK